MGTNSQQIASWTKFEVKQWFETRPAFMLFLGMASFIGLMVTIAFVRQSGILNEILRFIFISGMIWTIVAGFVFLNAGIAPYAPIGLVKKPPESGAWVVNIGGNESDNYEKGIQIPLFVGLFGIIGGYLRYLYKTAKLHVHQNRNSNDERTHPVSQVKNDKSLSRFEMFYRSLEDISILFLAPLLAIAVYFLLNVIGLEGDRANYTIAVISFTIGLVTDEAVSALISFTRSRISGSNHETTHASKNDQVTEI